MRYAGRISEWNDDKGYGFVAPNGGGERCFVHARDFEAGSRRPKAGDLISYEASLDPRGRPKAVRARHQEGRRADPPAARSAPLRPGRGGTWMGLAALGVAVAAWLAGKMPFAVAATYFGASGLSFLLYLFDKAAARRGDRRTPEMTLHVVDLLGGWPGALVAQEQFRHKTTKRSFRVGFWFTVLANLAGLAYFLRTVG